MWGGNTEKGTRKRGWGKRGGETGKEKGRQRTPGELVRRRGEERGSRRRDGRQGAGEERMGRWDEKTMGRRERERGEKGSEGRRLEQ